MAQKKESPKPTHAIEETKPGDVTEYDASLFSPDDTAGYGEGIDQGAFSIPFFGILQALSPVCQRGHANHIEGLQPGDIFNNVTKKVAQKLRVAVTRRSHTLCSWTPREDGSGFIGEEEAHVENMAEFAKILPDDKKRRIIEKIDQDTKKAKRIEITEHRNFYVVNIDEENMKLEPAIVSMTKSQLKTARDWNTLIDVDSAKVAVTVGGMQTFRPVLHSAIWELGTQLKTKDGNSWFVWTVKFVRLWAPTDRAMVTGVREKVQQARATINVQRQLEQQETESSVAEGDM